MAPIIYTIARAMYARLFCITMPFHMDKADPLTSSLLMYIIMYINVRGNL